MKPLRYAHNDGHTDLCFDDSGRYMLTCGTDGDVRIWQGIDDDDTISHRAGDTVYSIAFKNGRFFTASDSNSIQANTFPDGLPDGIVTRFTASINHMVLNESGTTMAAGSSDFTIKVVDIESSNHKVCRGHEAPVLSLALDPKQEYLVTIGCIDELMCVIFQSINVMCINKDQQYLAIGCIDELMCVIFQSINVMCINEDQQYLAIDELICVIFQSINVMCINKDQQYLAIGCNDGLIAIIDWKKNRFLTRYIHEKNLKITAIAWNPSENNQIAFCDVKGQLGVIDEAVSETDNQTTEGEFEGVFDDDDDMLIQATADKQCILDNEASEDVYFVDFLQDVKNDIDDDKSSIVSSVIPPVRPITDSYKPTPLQKPFQSASTPLHLSSRFMKWNSIGIIRQYNTDEETSIDIEFHDSSTHHPMHITNNMDYTIGDLSSQAVVLASQGEDGNPSKLTCLHFGSWDNCKEWTVTMDDDEDIQAVTIGDNWLAIGTSLRNIRLFTIAGIQLDILTIPGPIITMAAKNNKLIIVYHKGMGIVGDQLLGVTLLSIGRNVKTIFNNLTLPLSPKSTLTWIGINLHHSNFQSGVCGSCNSTKPMCLISMDSLGILRIYNTSIGLQWTQVANTKDHAKGKSDHYWIVSLHESPQQLRCIPCKGSRYPPTLPRPAVAILPYQLPLCEMTTEKSQYEECLWRNRIFSYNLPVNSYDRDDILKESEGALMKLFALSAKADREHRAIEVCKLMSENTLQLAIKYASRVRKLQLAERISQLAQEKTQEEDEIEEDNLLHTK
ncbi:hypothetical protein LOTGIDRAFT_110682 [Lottia gigantea]|uniref:Uncharacterized protein n=1 Tax=Lottia gigantea TaxID=225164 RepID=V4AYS8_LOTGI|nr:hypothetical protein LOTGIDRAFT_110682 [Lottia gigantea]ESP02838.1 hypothetical protein LOTGIDRAFT_110682 [Lottia gigantea]